MPVGLARQVLDLLAANDGARSFQVRTRPSGAEDLDRLDQRSIVREGVVVGERTDLVEDFVSGIARGIGEIVRNRRLERDVGVHEFLPEGLCLIAMGSGTPSSKDCWLGSGFAASWMTGMRRD